MKIGLKIIKNSNFICDSLYCNYLGKKYLIISHGLHINFYRVKSTMKLKFQLKVAIPICKIFPIYYKKADHIFLISSDGQYALYGRSGSIFNMHISFKGELFNNDIIKLSTYTKNFGLLYMTKKNLIIFSFFNYNKSINKKIFELIKDDEEVISILIVENVLYYLLLNGKNDLYIFSYLINDFNLDLQIITYHHIHSFDPSPFNFNIYLFGQTRAQLYINNQIYNIDQFKNAHLQSYKYTKYHVSSAVEADGINYLITKDGDFLKTINNIDFYLIGNLQKTYDNILYIEKNIFLLINENINYTLLMLNEPIKLFNITQLYFEEDYANNINFNILHNFSQKKYFDEIIYYFNICHSINLGDTHIYNIKIKYDFVILNGNMGAYIYRFNKDFEFILKLRYEIFDVEKIRGQFQFFSINGIYLYMKEQGALRHIKHIKYIQYGIFLKNGFLLFDNKNYLREYNYKSVNQLRDIKFTDSLYSMEYDGRYINIYTFESKKYIYSRNLELIRIEDYHFKKHIWFNEHHISWKERKLIVNKNEKIGSNLNDIVGGAKANDHLFLFSHNQLFAINSVNRSLIEREEEEYIKDNQFKIEDDFLLAYKNKVIISRLHLNFPVKHIRKFKYENKIYLFLAGEFSHFSFFQYEKRKFNLISQSYVHNQKFIDCKIIKNILSVLSTNQKIYFYQIEKEKLVFLKIFDIFPVDRIMTFNKNVLYFNFLGTGLAKLFFIEEQLDDQIKNINKQLFKNYAFKLIRHEEIINYNLLKEYINRNREIFFDDNILKLPYFKLKNKKYDNSSKKKL